MPDVSQGFQDQVRPAEEASQVSLVPDIVVISSEGEDKKSLELLSNQSGLSASQISVEVGVVKTTQAPKPCRTSSLLRGTSDTQPSADHDASVRSSCDELPIGNSSSVPMTSYSDSDYSSTKSSPGYDCSSFSADLCDVELSELEKTSSVSPINLSESSLDESNTITKANPDDEIKSALTAQVKEENLLSGSSPAFADVSTKLNQTRGSVDVRWAEDENGDDDKRSTRSRRSVKEGVCCCYQAVHRAFLRCVEETPATLSGLVLSLLFCVAIIILIPTTGRVSVYNNNSKASPLLFHGCS